MRKVLVLLLVVLAACAGGDGDEPAVCNGQTSRVDIRPGGDVETVDYSDDELDVLANACEASEHLDDEVLRAVGQAFVLEDYTAPCAALQAAADQMESNPVAAVEDGGAADLVAFVIGDAARFGQVEALSRECGDEFARYQEAIP